MNELISFNHFQIYCELYFLTPAEKLKNALKGAKTAKKNF